MSIISKGRGILRNSSHDVRVNMFGLPTCRKTKQTNRRVKYIYLYTYLGSIVPKKDNGE